MILFANYLVNLDLLLVCSMQFIFLPSCYHISFSPTDVLLSTLWPSATILSFFVHQVIQRQCTYSNQRHQRRGKCCQNDYSHLRTSPILAKSAENLSNTSHIPTLLLTTYSNHRPTTFQVHLVHYIDLFEKWWLLISIN